MSAERTVRNGTRYLEVTDAEGDYLTVVAPEVPGERAHYLAVVVLESGPSVGVTLEDGLALLSFLSDALGVERYAPTAAPGGAT